MNMLPDPDLHGAVYVKTSVVDPHPLDPNVYLQKVKSKKLFCWRLEGQGRKQQDSEPDPDRIHWSEA
jgi:hypothetical protein